MIEMLNDLMVWEITEKHFCFKSSQSTILLDFHQQFQVSIIEIFRTRKKFTMSLRRFVTFESLKGNNSVTFDDNQRVDCVHDK